MSGQISADFEQMLENIHTLVKSVEAAGAGTRPTDIDGLDTPTTRTYLAAASQYAQGLERLISSLATQADEFRETIRAVLEQKQQSEEVLSSTLRRIEQIVEVAPSAAGDPSATATATATATAADDDGGRGF